MGLRRNVSRERTILPDTLEKTIKFVGEIEVNPRKNG